MRIILNQFLVHGRRLAGLTALALIVLFILPRGNFAPPHVPPLEPNPARRILAPHPARPETLGIADLHMSRSLLLQVRPPDDSQDARADAPPPLPAAPAARESSVLGGQAPSLLAEAGPEVAGQAEEDAGDSAATEEAEAANLRQVPAEVALRARVIVHPRVPERVIAKRKIDNSVLLQPLVGSDGHVRQVRVLRSIPDCEECNHSAIAAAEQYVYDAPPGGSGPAEAWTTPVEIRFSYRRAKGR